jgi:hypothetical protein
MKPTDQAIFGMVSESPGRNVREPSGGLDKKLTPEVEPSPQIGERRTIHIAIAALARKLAHVPYAMWKHQTTYDPTHSAQSVAT